MYSWISNTGPFNYSLSMLQGAMPSGLNRLRGRSHIRTRATVAIQLLAFTAFASGVPSPGDTLHFTVAPYIFEIPTIRSIMVLDVDADGRNDIVGVPLGPLPSDLRQLAVFYQDEDNRIDSFVKYDTLLYGADLDTIDVNWDGVMDVVAADAYGKGIRIFVYKPDSGLVEFLRIPNSWGAPAINVADLNSDSLPDIVAVQFYRGSPDSFKVYYQGPKSVFDSVRWYPLEKRAYEGAWTSVHPGDFNADGLVDVAISGGPPDQVLSTYLQRPDGTLQHSQHLAFPYPIRMLIPEDMNDDGRVDLLAPVGFNVPDAKIGVFYQNQEGLLETEPVWIDEFHIPYVIRFADMNRDGHRDMVVGHAYWSYVTVHLKIPSGGFEPYQLFEFVTRYAVDKNAITVGDLNCDGLPDIAGCDPAGHIGILYNATRVAVSGIEASEGGVPNVLVLHQNYPNPFNGVTRIGFILPSSGEVSVEVFDELGRSVRRVMQGRLASGSHQVYFDGSTVASGIYYCVLSTLDGRLVKPMLLLK